MVMVMVMVVIWLGTMFRSLKARATYSSFPIHRHPGSRLPLTP
jgi:hypothetical protein